MSDETPVSTFRIDTLDARVQEGPSVSAASTTKRPLADLNELDDYSRSFLEILLRRFPEWHSAAQIAECDGTESLWLEVAAPSPAFGDLWISTEDGQITLGAGPFHTHFATYPPATDEDVFCRAADFIADVINERLVLALATKGSDYCCGWVQSPHSPVEAPTFTRGMARITLRSWNASLDREIEITEIR